MKTKIKIFIDILMLAGMFGALNYQIFSGSAHKRISAVLYLLFILHNLLNYRWYKTLLKGKYKPFRMIQTVVNILVILSMFGILYSGILLAKEIAGGIVTEGMTAARMLHITASYLGALGMVVHGGLHVRAVRLRILNLTRREACYD